MQANCSFLQRDSGIRAAHMDAGTSLAVDDATPGRRADRSGIDDATHVKSVLVSTGMEGRCLAAPTRH
jgi:hypothetical protein